MPVEFMRSLFRKFVFVLMCVSSLLTFSQEEDSSIITNQVWLEYYTYYYFKPKWELYGDVGYRFIPEDFRYQRIQIRPSLRYVHSSLWEAHGGIGFFQTFYKDTINTFEIRPWEGIRIKWPTFDVVDFTHYFRLEERIVLPQNSKVEFNFRLRYRLGMKIYAWRIKNNGRFFIPAYVEVFGNFGPEIQEAFSNRARLMAGAGYRTISGWTFEFNFIGQHARSGTDDVFSTSDRLYLFKVRRHLFKKDYGASKTPDK